MIKLALVWCAPTTVDSHDSWIAVTVRAERLLAAAEAWQPCGASGYPVLTSAVSLFGVRAGVVCRLDQHEVGRRDALGLDAITDRHVLDGLMGLPAGIPVSVDALTERQRRLFRRVPEGMIEFDGDQLVRRAVPPLTVGFALVPARDWHAGLVQAGRYAPFCARAMLLPEPPVDLQDATMQAGYYGIGIGVITAGVLRVLVEPEPYVRRRHSSAQWWVNEEIYRVATAAATV